MFAYGPSVSVQSRKNVSLVESCAGKHLLRWRGDLVSVFLFQGVICHAQRASIWSFEGGPLFVFVYCNGNTMQSFTQDPGSTVLLSVVTQFIMRQTLEGILLCGASLYSGK